MAMFEGSSCDDKTCKLPREYQLENQGTQPTVTWLATEGMSYFLHVAGVNAAETGAFILDVEEVSLPAAPANDACNNAEGLTNMDSATVDTSGPLPHGLENADCSLHADSRGAFYSVAATGNFMAFTLTATDVGLDNQGRLEIAVMEKGCNTCIKVSDFLKMEDTPFTLEFETVRGKSYVVAVSGERFSDVGTFDVSLEEGEPAPDAADGKLSGVFPPPSKESDMLSSSASGSHFSSFTKGLVAFGAAGGMLANAIF